MSSKVKGLVQRLKDGENVICAEGYMWELERRGYIRSGAFTPEVVVDYPERVRSLHEEFVHAGSDVVEAFTYYGHRSKMKIIGREDELETLNLTALKIAREVADRTGTLMAGNLSNTTTYDPQVPERVEEVKNIFREQVEWAVQGGADYIIGETFDSCSEATLALEAILKYGNGLPAVITLVPYCPDRTTDDVPFPQALRKLEEAGAAVVGLNCGRGPKTMLPLLREVRKVCKGPMAALPVPFRTIPSQKAFQSLKDPDLGTASFPLELAPHSCTRAEVRQFAQEALKIGIQYIGLCCGSSSNLLRELAVAFGRNPPSMKYEPNVQQSISSCTIKEYSENERVKKVQAFMLGLTQ